MKYVIIRLLGICKYIISLHTSSIAVILKNIQELGLIICMLYRMLYNRRKYYWCTKIRNSFCCTIKLLIFQYYDSKTEFFSFAPHINMAFPNFAIAMDAALFHP